MMKKMFALAAAASISLASFGALERVGAVQIADVDSLVKGISTLGEFTGNPMLGLMVSQSVWKMPQVRLFGNGRPGEATALVAYAPAGAKPGDAQDLHFAVIYPVVQAKKEFLAAHPDAVDEDGVIRLVKDSDCMFSHAAFSPDGKWAAAGDDKDAVLSALGDTKAAARKMDGNIVRVSMPRKGLAFLAAAADSVAEKKAGAAAGDKSLEAIQASMAKARSRRLSQVLESVSDFVLGLRVNEKGLDARIAVKTVKGSKLEALSPSPLPAKWIAADPAAVYAFDGMVYGYGKKCEWNDISAVFKKNGVDVSSFVSVAHPVPESDVCTIDAAAACAWVKKLPEIASSVSKEGFLADIAALAEKADCANVCKPAPPRGAALVLKGFKPVADPQTRFERTLPEAKAKPVFSRMFLSYYSMVKGLVPVILANVDENERAMLAPMLNSLPPEGQGGIAAAQWRDGDLVRMLLRVSPDEFKGLSAGITLFTAMRMNSAAPASAK